MKVGGGGEGGCGTPVIRLHSSDARARAGGAGPGTTFPTADLVNGGFSSVSIRQTVQVQR